jgi:rubrerythrin
MVPDRKITTGELVRAIRLTLSAEEEATHLYMALADATDNALGKKVLIDIADEERVHVGEFQRLIQILTGDEDKWLANGAAEVDKMAAAVAAEGGKAPASGGEKPSIGSLKG